MYSWQDKMRGETQSEETQLKIPPIGECPFCHNKDVLYSIRGQQGCIHCQFDRLWDFIEENRRNIGRLEEE